MDTTGRKADGAFDLARTYVQLADGPAAVSVAVAGTQHRPG